MTSALGFESGKLTKLQDLIHYTYVQKYMPKLTKISKWRKYMLSYSIGDRTQHGLSGQRMTTTAGAAAAAAAAAVPEGPRHSYARSIIMPLVVPLCARTRTVDDTKCKTDTFFVAMHFCTQIQSIV